MGKPTLNAVTRGHLTAHPHDNVLRWRVGSLTRPGEIEHVVDLATFHGNGSCSCEHFEFRLAPLLRDGITGGKPTRCGHILVAREAFTNHMLQILTAKAAEFEATHETAPCPECHGDTEDTDGNPCPYCEGAGSVPA